MTVFEWIIRFPSNKIIKVFVLETTGSYFILKCQNKYRKEYQNKYVLDKNARVIHVTYFETETTRRSIAQVKLPHNLYSKCSCFGHKSLWFSVKQTPYAIHKLKINSDLGAK